MISWRILAPLLTALGAFPIFAFVYIAPAPNEPLYIFGYLYVSIVIAFIAGIDWIIAIEEQQGAFLIWSIVLSMLPLAIIAEFICFHYGSRILWSQYLLLIWLSLFIDWRFFNKLGVSYYLKFRLTGTIVLSLAIALCLLNP
ncbi:hypothetical protein [Legionella sp. W05-934-2]|jgi:hypothetical protein|uniref:hypothetical protein n=1 Tax=Legionella sp. W05-934-2 TaxID=1198649 RepID=UPI0034624A6A